MVSTECRGDHLRGHTLYCPRRSLLDQSRTSGEEAFQNFGTNRCVTLGVRLDDVTRQSSSSLLVEFPPNWDTLAMDTVDALFWQLTLWNAQARRCAHSIL